MLITGSRLGPYTILAPLGAGGMGEVYRARDPRLGREVAVKVLPAGVSGDADRLRRFEQEARAASALNHPNILTVFDTGSQDGTVYLVTEILEGETLRGRLAGGALPARKAVEIGIQIARGLAAAHERGIVHRDLKPENLFLTRDGRVKILDFGLAKLQAPLDLADAPTVLTGTEPGVVLGTVGYMAPEQVRGQPVDHRADLFALGAVFYEMLTGRRAFQRDSAAETMAAILREEPPDLADSGRVIPPGLERVIRHCLEKDPLHRFQSASDLAFDLESVSALSGTGASPVKAVRRRGLLRTAAVVGLLLAAAFLLGILAQRRWESGELPRFHRLTFRRGNVVDARFAPEGQTIVYSASWEGGPYEIFTTRTDSPESRPLGLPSALLQSISPRGQMLLDLVQEGDGARGYTLAQAPLAGGAPRPILEGSRRVYADWAPDGEAFALLRRDDERGWWIEYPQGKVLWRSEFFTWGLRVAPAGDALAFCEIRDRPVQTVIMLDRAGKVVARSGGWSLPITGEGSPRGCAVWAPGGKEVWFAASRQGGESGLYALSRSGEVRPLLRVPDTLALLDIARDGRVLLTQVQRRSSMMALAPGEAAERDLSWFDASRPADLSADGRWLLFTEQGQGGGEQASVYLRGTDGSPAVRLGDGWGVALSPDGRWALAGSVKGLTLLPTGAGEPRVLPPAPVGFRGAQWLPGGKQLLVLGTQPGQRDRIYLMDVGAKTARPVTRAGVRFWVSSPDGSRIAVLDADGLKLYPTGGGEPRTPPVVLSRKEHPLQWRADGRALYMGRMAPGGGFWIDEVDLATGRRVRWKELRLADPAGFGFLLMAPGGAAYVYNVNRLPIHALSGRRAAVATSADHKEGSARKAPAPGRGPARAPRCPRAPAAPRR
ncbi:MAG TPA: protein kinase [Thermoanaerobaculia bacterium]|nr:protein kinase [Thermoanaerobaculia bacterium]